MTIVEIVITNVTAAPIPNAESIFLETPRNGHIPKNWVNTILLTKIAVMNMDIYVSMTIWIFNLLIIAIRKPNADKGSRCQYKN